MFYVQIMWRVLFDYVFKMLEINFKCLFRVTF
jgi:hypothetical protein